MSPTDKNKSSGNSTSGKGQQCSDSNSLEFQPKLAPPTTLNVTSPGHDTIANIPLVTASQSTTKCSINDQMKTFDPGECGIIERLNHSGNPQFRGRCSLVKNNKNYKAGSKINKLADMLAKRSQNVVEVKENTSDVMVTSAPIDGTIPIKSLNGFENLNGSVFRKSRRKSMPNQSCGFNQIELQSTSKSCSDFMELFLTESSGQRDINALGGSFTNLQTEESTKKKAVRKNLRNVELPLILPERKRRTVRNDVARVVEKCLDPLASAERVKSPNEISSSLQSPNRSVSSTNIRKGKRKSKRLVENSTQTADIEFISVIKPKIGDKSATEIEKNIETFKCFYCAETFSLEPQLKAHERMHHIKNIKLLKCQFCSKKMMTLEELRYHSKQKHPSRYPYCIKCNEEFANKEEMYTHNKEIHFARLLESRNVVDKSSEVQEKKKDEEDKKSTKIQSKGDLKIDVSFDSPKKSSVSPRSIQKCSPKENKTEEQIIEQEMLFYSHLSGNIQENLTNHLDGKIDKSGNPVRTDQINEPLDNSGLLFVACPSTVPDVQVSRAPSPYQTRSKTPNPLPATAKKFKKLPNWQQKFWEKYNFPTNYRYEHRFWDKNYFNSEKSAFYLKDLSCLDIKTQLTMRENIKKLDDVKKVEENSKNMDNLNFPDYLSLMPRVDPESFELDASKSKKQGQRESFKSPGPDVKTRKKLENFEIKKRSVEGLKMMTRRQSSLELAKDEKSSKKRKGSLDLSSGQKMTLRRQTSLENLGSESKIEKDDPIIVSSDTKHLLENVPLSPIGSSEISGEWVRPRSYLCGTCCTKFTNLWELEDHKWVSHPNVWCTHYEFEDEKIDKLFLKNEDESPENVSGENSEMSKSKLTDLYKRYLLPYGSLKTAKLVPKMNFPEQCTKCKKNCMNSSEMHKHMLDCGGDTTWFLTMYSSPLTIKRKWRPFGSRRKKQIGRRDVKRNIPSTPTLRTYHYQHRIRTKPGDVETIQKMLANLPEKRARRAINFDEIKTRSQATIHSNRLLRKRFKTSFSSGFLKLKAMKQKRLKQEKKESSKSTTDTSTESTPIGSPKRRNKAKESLKLIKEDNSRDGSSDTSEDMSLKLSKKKIKSKKKSESSRTKNDLLKPKIKQEVERPMTRSSVESRSKRKQSKEEIFTVVQEIPKKGKKKLSKPTEMEIVKLEETVDRAKEELMDNKTKVEESEQKKTVISSRCNPILKFKEDRKAKTELLKSMKKKLKNSKKILKQAEKAGSRRSLRLKYLQQAGETLESNKPFENVAKESSKNLENVRKQKKPAKVIDASTLRRSLRNSLSFEEKVDEVSESKNYVNDHVSVSDTTKRLQSDRNLRSVKEPNRFQKSPEGDLEEMPILAKVQPIRGKVSREKEIPVLMPVEEPVTEDSISFQVIKKRRTAFKEVTPLKIVKKVEKINECPESSAEIGKRKKKFPETPVSERVEKRIKTERKYFLGIDPNEIDKGRHEESGSDSEPLISLVQATNQAGDFKKDLEETKEINLEEKLPPIEVEKNLQKDVVVEENKRIEESLLTESQETSNIEDNTVQEEEEAKRKTSKKKKVKETLLEPEENPSFLERRSRRVSKEIKSSNEFVIDDPLILVDELWSDLDSDTDSKRKNKKNKKKISKKEKKTTDVNLEELLRNFGENSKKKVVQKPGRSIFEIRKALENRVVEKSYRRLSLKLFSFNKIYKNFGNRGERFSAAKKAAQRKLDEIQASLPDLPFLAAEIKENPVQVIQCGVQKPKTKTRKKSRQSDIHLKISLPLENINNITMINNNHLISDEPKLLEEVEESQEEKENQEVEIKNKSKRSEVIDKIFYCEICKTYYYSSSQLKIHKLSNRHKIKEAEQVPKENPPVTELDYIEAERINEDTLEMPTLEGPFIENPLTRVEPVVPPPPQPQPPPTFGFSQESLKDIQRAIGCTDEEMLILTLLGENTVENDILDLDTCKTVHPMNGNRKDSEDTKENEKTNGTLKIDLKQRMTSALACLVNKAVFNLLQKYETAAKSAINPEALSLLGKLSNLSRRKNIFQLNELLRKNDGESSVVVKDTYKKEPAVSYKYQCTICGSRFEKASTRECHISRSHKGKAKKAEDESLAQTAPEDDWNSWNFDVGDDHLENTNTSQFWCSDCGINFLSPQEVLNHQKLEHQTSIKEHDQTKDSVPLQSSTIGSSDEIIEGKKIRKRTKLFSSEELDQQRIIANNELRKLDRKFSKKSGKIKWGMDALKFTVEKENKVVTPEEEKEITSEETVKPLEIKNIDLVPKLNLSRISNIPEFKVIQKNSFKNRFQKIIDNKLKRKSVTATQENEQDEIEEVMLVPVVVKKKSKKPKLNKYSKKEKCVKPLDVYDFNESESEGEPELYSHIKKPPSTKLKLVKLKESPSKNKADSTTKAPDDYDSEDSLPLSVVKKAKPEEDEDDKGVKLTEDKADGILEQVEYLIEQLENETGQQENEPEKENGSPESQENLTISVETKFPELDLPKTSPKPQEEGSIAESSFFDEEDSIPLVLMKKSEEIKEKNVDVTDVSTTSDDYNRFRSEEKILENPPTPEAVILSESESREKPSQPFETLNGNVIYCRNDSVSDFGSDISNDGLIDSNFEQLDKNSVDTSIIFSKSEDSNEKEPERRQKRYPLLSATIKENFLKSESPKPYKEAIVRKIWSRRKLTENSSEDSFISTDENTHESQAEVEKEIIVKKIWSRKKPEEDIEKPEESDLKINQTEVSDEVVIKCGPKAKPSKRQKRSLTSETSKETIMRKIWSGRFQTKAALKTYESDMISNCKENDDQGRCKRRRSGGFSGKRSRVESDDDLDSLLEEIEREQLEKAIRSEFLQLRRSEKANVDLKESLNPTVGIFAETIFKRKEIPDRKRKRVSKIKHKRQSALKRKKFIKKPIRRIFPVEEKIFSENRMNPEVTPEQEDSLNKNGDAFAKSKIKNRKHKKHRHKHHHHKHKHKKSKHRKDITSKHKTKHKLGDEKADCFTLLEKICKDIPNRIEREWDRKSSETSDEKTKDATDFEDREKHYGTGKIYEFVEDSTDSKSQNVSVE